MDASQASALMALDGLNAASVQALLSELCHNLAAFPTVKHFCSWLHLAPHDDISGGKVWRSRTLKARNRAGQIFRMAAQSLSRTDTALGAVFRKVRAKAGPKKVIVVTAHKLARAFYYMLKRREAYRPTSIQDCLQRERQRQRARLEKQARQLGLLLVPSNSQPSTSASF